MLQWFFYVDSSTNYCILGKFPLEKCKKSLFCKNVGDVSGSTESSLMVLVSCNMEATLEVCNGQDSSKWCVITWMICVFHKI